MMMSVMNESQLDLAHYILIHVCTCMASSGRIYIYPL